MKTIYPLKVVSVITRCPINIVYLISNRHEMTNLGDPLQKATCYFDKSKCQGRALHPWHDRE